MCAQHQADHFGTLPNHSLNKYMNKWWNKKKEDESPS